MAFLIAVELMTLLFAMQTLSAVRTIVGGEGLWSKAQKDAVQYLQKYATTKNPKYLERFHDRIKVHHGFSRARVEIETAPVMDMNVVTEGLLAGGTHPEDVANSVRLMRWFKDMEYVDKTSQIWRVGDIMIAELVGIADEIEKRIHRSPPMSQTELETFLNRISDLNDDMTVLEYQFSATLGEASRWLEHLLMKILVLIVITVEGTGLLLTISFTRRLVSTLKELNSAAARVEKGDFSVRVPVYSSDELGQLAGSINRMAQSLHQQTQSRHQAEQASHAKNLFLANMSHEIRTPLNAILGFSELLRDPETSEKQKLRYLDIIKRTGHNLATIINDILDITKIEAEQLEIEKSKFSLKAFIEDLQLLLRLRCDEKGIELHFESQGDIQDNLISDPLRLRQILLNIIGNAIKFTDKGYVHVTYYVREGLLEFRVEDTGIGIPMAQRDLLFHPFSQGDSSVQKKHGGTGLGLVLSQKLAQLLGGDVKLLRSEPKMGSTFLVQVAYEPVINVSATHVLTSTSEPTPQTNRENASWLQGKKVLVVEDTLDSQLLLQLYLTKAGAGVEVANNGQEALQKSKDHYFDLILMDMQMPVMDGFTAARALRDRRVEAPIIALTAYSMIGDREKTLQAGCTDYLSKPIDKNRLFKVIHRYL